MTQVALESPDQPEVIALIGALDDYQRSLYPPESCHLLDLATLLQPKVLFAVARDASGAAVGCAAIVLQAGDGELKRFYLQPGHRRQGLAGRLLALLEQQAVVAGCQGWLRLETGPFQPEALAFYRRQGYAECARFGSYADDPLSVFMHKRLGAVARQPGRGTAHRDARPAAAGPHRSQARPLDRRPVSALKRHTSTIKVD